MTNNRLLHIGPRNWLFCAVTLFAVATTCVACSSSSKPAVAPSAAGSSSGSSTTSESTEVVSITIATAGASASFTGGYLAVDKGLLTKYHLKTGDIEALSAPACVAAVTSGNVDVCADGGGLFAAKLTSPSSIAIVSAYSTSAQELYGASGVTSVAQLKGKTVGVTNPGDPKDVSTRAYLIKNGLTPDKDVKIAYLASATAVLSALKVGSIAAGAMSPPTDAQAAALGMKDLANLVPFTQPNALAVNGKFAKAHPDAVVNFLRAMRDGTAMAKSDETDAESVIAKYTGVTDPPTVKQAYESAVQYLDVTPYPVDQTTVILQGLAATVPAAKTADPASVVDSTFIAKIGTS